MTRSNNKPRSKALPKRLCISIGGYFGPCYEVAFKKGRLTYTYLTSRDLSSQELELGPQPQREEMQPSAKQWETFRRSLDRLNVWCWQENYLDPGVCDGTNWSVEIAYPDKATISHGSNCYPGHKGEPLDMGTEMNDRTFAKFCRAVARLIGREFH
jgi:hypothetical protein